MTWYVFGDLPFLADILNGVAAVTSEVGGDGGDFTGAIRLAALVAIVTALIQSLTSTGQLRILPIFAVMIFITAALAPKEEVTMENIYTGQTRTIDNIPIGVAATGAVFSQLGHWMTETIETAFSYPGLTADGFGRAITTWREIRMSAADPSSYVAANTAGGGNFADSWISYVSTCTSFGSEIGALNTGGILNGQYAQNALGYANPALGALIYVSDGVSSNLDCKDAHEALLTYSKETFLPALKGVLAARLFDPNFDADALEAGDVDARFAAVLASFGSVDLDTDETLLSLYVGSLFDSGVQRRLSLDGKTDYSVMVADAIRARNAQWKAQGDMFTRYALPAISFIEGFFYAMSPVIVIIALLSGLSAIGLIGRYSKLGLWIQLWSPSLAVVNLYLFHKVTQSMANLDGAALVPSSIAGQFAADSVVQDFMGMAGLFASSAPLLALFLLTGSVYTFNTLASSISGPDTVNETTAAPRQLERAPIFTELPRFEMGSMSGSAAPGAGDILPKFSVSNQSSETIQSAERALSGARSAYMQALDTSLNTTRGKSAENREGLIWRDTNSASNSSVYQTLYDGQLSDVIADMRSSGASESSIQRTLLSGALNGSAGLRYGKGGETVGPYASGGVSGGATVSDELVSQVGESRAKEFANRISESFSENERASADLAEAFSRDQSRGWSQSGYSSTAFAESASVREEGGRYAQAEKSFEEAVMESRTSGNSQELNTPYIANRIASDPAQFRDFAKLLQEETMTAKASSIADIYTDGGYFSPDAHGRKQALVAGGLKTMMNEGREDLIGDVMKDIGLIYHGADGAAAANRKVGTGAYGGPSVDLSGAGAGLDYVEVVDAPASSLEAIHNRNVNEARSNLDARVSGQAAALVKEEHQDAVNERENRSTGNIVFGGASGIGRNLWDDILYVAGADKTLSSRMSGYRNDALSAGATNGQAELYAVLRSQGRGWFGVNDDVKEQLENKIVSEYNGNQDLAATAIKRVEHAARGTQEERDYVFGQLQGLNEISGVQKDSDDKNLVQRNLTRGAD